MMSQEQNDLITRVGPSAPAGKLMRMYWQPAALVDELEGSRPIKPVKLLGENFVLFKDEKGRYGLMDRDCPHRGADLAFGRLENGGLRCAFHGWLFDVNGQCLETPAEPAGSSLCKNIKQRAYPVIETLASMRRKAKRDGHSVGQPDRVHWHMLAYRRYARRLVPGGPVHLRNPATSVVTWPLPILAGILAAIAYASVLGSAFFFFLTVFIYGLLYRVMSLNAPHLPLGLARLL